MLIAVLFVISGCGGSYEQVDLPKTASTAATPNVVPGTFTTADLKKLRWIEGSWRGTGDVEKPFFERYRFEDDSTLAVDSFPDETLSKVEDTSRFRLKDGQFGNEGDIRWVATKLDDNSILFEPVAKAKNSFSWTRESADVWMARLSWPAQEQKPARERVYRMERITAK